MKKIEDVIKNICEEVYSILGPGYKEEVYESALAHELRIQGIPYERQRSFEVIYKGYSVGTARTDITIYPKWSSKKEEECLLELKAVKSIQVSHKKQAQVYMASLNIPIGFVISFTDPNPIIEPVESPKLEPREIKVISKIKKEKISLSLFKRIADEVFNYFGIYFLFMDDKIKYYLNAVAVELRLHGIEYHTFEKEILYKNMPVGKYGYDIMLEDGTVVCVESYSLKKGETPEKVIEEAIENERKFFQILGIKKGFYIGIPTREGDNVVVREI